MKIKDAKKINRIRCIFGMIFCILMFMSVFIGVVKNLTNLHNDIGEGGVRGLRMFTVLSNILVSISALLCIPFQVEGLRRRNYHLPRWIITIMFIGTSGVALTFGLSVTALSAVIGYKEILFSGSNLFLHTICPILAIFLFTVVNDDHTFKFKTTFIGMGPMIIYSLIYIIMVFIIGEENGGWRDHYHFNTFIPWPLTAIIMYSFTFGITTLLRVIHNNTHKKRKKQIEKYYKESKEFSFDNISDAIKNLAISERNYDLGGDIIVPKRILIWLKEKYNSNESLDKLAQLYIKYYIDDINVINED